MVALVNLATGKPEQVANAERALADGTHAPDPTATYTAIRPDGRAVSFGAAGLQAALAKDYVLETPDQREARKTQQKYGGDTIAEAKATALGAARGLSFGASDVALRATGALSAEDLRGYEQANPVASTVGEIGGVAGGLLLGGALGAGVRGAAALGETAAAAMTTGLVERAGVAGSSLAVRAAAATAPAAVRGIVEGGIYGAGQGVTQLAMRDESQLGTPSQAAEVLMAHAGLGMVMGGAVSAGVGGATALGVGGARRMLRAFLPTELPESLAGATAAGKDIPEASLPADGPVAPTATAPDGGATGPMDAIRDFVLRKSSGPAATVAYAIAGTDRDVVKTLLQPGAAGVRARAVVTAGDDIVQGQTRKVTGLLTGIEDDASVMINQARGTMKADRIKKLVGGGAGDEAQVNAAMDTVSKLHAFVEQYSGEEYAGGHIGGLRRITKAANALQAKLEGAINADADDLGAKAFMGLDDLKRLVGREARPGGVVSSSERPVVDAVRDLYNGVLQPQLEDSALWGQAGTMQAAINKRWVALLDAKQTFSQRFMAQVGRTSESNSWENRFVADPAKIKTFLSGAGRAENDLNQQILSNQVQATSDFAKSVRELYDLQGAPAEVAQNLVANAGQTQATLREALADAALRNDAKELLKTRTGRALEMAINLDRATSLSPSTRAALIDELRRAQAEPGAVRGDIQGISDQLRDIHAEQVQQREMSAMGLVIKSTIRGVKASIDAAVDGTASLQNAGITTAMAGAEYLRALPPDAQPDDKESYDDDGGKQGSVATLRRVMRSVTQYQANPEALIDQAHGATEGLRKIAPKAAAVAPAIAARALAVMAQASPKPDDFGLLPAQRKAWTPSPGDLAAFGHVVRAVTEPLSVPHDLAAGTLTREGVQAMGQVYPQLHDMMVMMIGNKLAQSEDVPLQRRLQLQALFDLQTDVLTSPDIARMIGQSYAPPQSGARGGRPGTMTDREHAARTVSTATQRLGA